MPPATNERRLILLMLAAGCLLASAGERATAQTDYPPAPLWNPPAPQAPSGRAAAPPPWGAASDGATDAAPRVAALPASYGKGSALDLAPPEAPAEGDRMELRPAAPTGSPGASLDPAGMLVTTGTSLAVVLGLFFLVMWLVRGGRPAGAKTLPVEAWEVLGRGQLDKTPVRLVRCGGKLLLVAVASGEVRTLTEIDDPAEVARLSALCGSTAADAGDFREVYDAARRGGKVRHA